MIDIDNLISILTIILMALIFAFIIFVIIYSVVKFKEKNKEKNQNKEHKIDVKEDIKESKQKTSEYSKQSIFSFMEFDRVQDNMVIQKNGNRFLMIIECQGINYDLMSEPEQDAVEQGFCQFLNTLRSSVQIYIQTRNVNLKESLNMYKKRIQELEDTVKAKRRQYEINEKSGKYSEEELKKQFFELTKITNLYEYGKDVVYNTETMSTNKNVLTKKYYIIVPFYSSEIESGEYEKSEIQNMAFSELYSRAQSIMSSIAVCGVNSKILDSKEIIELLYYTYNRDEASIGDLDKQLYNFEEIYSTAPNVLDKRIKYLKEEIEKKAMELAQNKAIEAKNKKELEIERLQREKEKEIRQLAMEILDENLDFLGADVTNLAKMEIEAENRRKEEKAKKKKEKGEAKDVKNAKDKPKRKTSSSKKQ